VPNAGVPGYTGVFGRDTLTAGWQSAMLGPEVSRGALAFLAANQATDDDPFRDAAPGRLLHEVRRGPLSELDIIPQRAYYGSQTTPAMFVLALSELWHWTGDTDALRRFRDPAMRALEWAGRYGDLDGDGFLESLTRSFAGLHNQGWKDSSEAIRYPDGRNVRPPLATVEEQAFYIIALERIAEVLVALEEDDEADRMLARATDLRRRWHEAFWLADEGFYAMALDADKRPVASIGSNAGHALGAGVVPREIAARVADRLLEPDLFSGWGVRTLSARHPSYNPFAYHLGSVWPVEQATFALGMRRYGLDDQAERLITAMLQAADAFRDHRRPEALSGLGREESPVPVPTPDPTAPRRGRRPQRSSSSRSCSASTRSRRSICWRSCGRGCRPVSIRSRSGDFASAKRSCRSDLIAVTMGPLATRSSRRTGGCSSSRFRRRRMSTPAVRSTPSKPGRSNTPRDGRQRPSESRWAWAPSPSRFAFAPRPLPGGGRSLAEEPTPSG
jgi:glycogen debranching enzyme